MKFFKKLKILQCLLQIKLMLSETVWSFRFLSEFQIY